MKIRAVKRTQCRNAVGAAAYRGGRDLWNERTGDLYKYAWRADVRDARIVLPQSLANDPEYEWAKNPYLLWNTAEFSEVRRNSHVAREYMMILPPQLSREQRRDVVYRFAQSLADRYGNAVDVALHDRRTGRALHYHAHLLATIRGLGPEGLLERTDADAGYAQRRERGLTKTAWQEEQETRGLWETMLQEAVEDAKLPPHIYDALKRQYGKGESWREYLTRLTEQGFDLRGQQRHDYHRKKLTPEQRQTARQKKRDNRRFRRLQRDARKERSVREARERRLGHAPNPADRNKILWLPRWDAHQGLLNPWEVLPQKRRRGQTPGMMPWQAKETPQAEPAFEYEDSYDPRAPYEHREEHASEEIHVPQPEHQPREEHQPRPLLQSPQPTKAPEPERDLPAPETIPIPPGDSLDEQLAQKLTRKADDGREVQAHRERFMEMHKQRPEEEHQKQQSPAESPKKLEPAPHHELRDHALGEWWRRKLKQRSNHEQQNRPLQERFAGRLGFSSAATLEEARERAREQRKAQQLQPEPTQRRRDYEMER